MSLIIEALKKAQKIRYKEQNKAPFFENRRPVKKNHNKKILYTTLGLSFLFIIIFLSSMLIPTKSHKPISEVPIIEDKKPASYVMKNSENEIIPKLEIKTDALKSKKEESDLIKPQIKPQTEKKAEKKKIEIPIVKPTSEKVDTGPRPAGEVINNEKENLLTNQAKKNEKESLAVEIKDESKEDLSIKKDIITRFNLAISFHNQKNISEAIKAYRHVIEMDPNFFEAYNNLGLIYLEMGDYDNSLKTLKEAIEINPNYEKALNNLGIIYYLKGDNKKAMEVFQKAIEINPNNVEGYIHLGIIYMKKGQWEKGIESYQKALSIQPGNGEAHYNLGILYENTGNKDMAIYHYKKFIEIAEKDYPDLVLKVSNHLRSLLRKK